jgi:peptide/nickel transport system permease protein
MANAATSTLTEALPPAKPIGPLVTPRSRRIPTRHRLWQLRAGLTGLGLVALIVVAAIAAPVVAPHDPLEQDITARLLPPVWATGGGFEYLLGTDRVGRDVLSRIIYGARISLEVGALGVLIASSIGVLLGIVAGYFGGRLDAAASALVNLFLAFPFILLAIATVAVLGPSFVNMIIVLGVTSWPVYARLVRVETVRLREQDFVLAGRALGASPLRIIRSYILPNLMATIVVLSSLEVARLIVLESFLSFLGLGIQPPTPSWGGMLAEGRTYIFNMWWLATFPGLAIFVTTLGINLFGDALRDVLDPRMRGV